jgi:hypothetical protein
LRTEKKASGNACYVTISAAQQPNEGRAYFAASRAVPWLSLLHKKNNAQQAHRRSNSKVKFRPGRSGSPYRWAAGQDQLRGGTGGEEGRLVVRVHQKFRQISLSAAEAKQKVLEPQLNLAEVKLKNAQTFRARNVSSEMQLLEAQAQRDIAAANVDEAKVNVQAAKLQLDQISLPLME